MVVCKLVLEFMRISIFYFTNKWQIGDKTSKMFCVKLFLSGFADECKIYVIRFW